MPPPRRGGIRRSSASVVRPSVCLSDVAYIALTRKPKGLGRRNFAQGYPRSHATPTPTSRSKGQKSRWGGGIMWRPPSRTACYYYCYYISINFCRFILLFHQMALIFPWVPIVFTLSSFEYASPRKCKCSFSEMTSFFSSSCVLVSSNCKQSITVRFLLLTFYWHRFKAWQDAPIVCHCKTIFPCLTKH